MLLFNRATSLPKVKRNFCVSLNILTRANEPPNTMSFSFSQPSRIGRPPFCWHKLAILVALLIFLPCLASPQASSPLPFHSGYPLTISPFFFSPGLLLKILRFLARSADESAVARMLRDFSALFAGCFPIPALNFLELLSAGLGITPCTMIQRDTFSPPLSRTGLAFSA